MPPHKKNQSGFTLIEILIALGLLALIAAVTFFFFNPAKSKGQILYISMGSVANAAQRYSMDTSCYPFATALLFNSSLASSTANSCSASLAGSWNGPYMKTRPTNASNNILLSSLGPGADLTIMAGSWIIGGPAVQYAVIAQNVPQATALQAFKACAGSGPRVTSGSNTVAGNCFVGTPTGGVNAVGYVFAGN